MVRIDLETNESVVLPLDSMPGPITPLGDELIVVAYREWQSSEEEVSGVGSERPVVWSNPGLETPFDASEIDTGFDIARPVWRISSGGAERVDLGGDVESAVSLDGEQLFATVRRADHPVAVTSEEFGSMSFSYPASSSTRTSGVRFWQSFKTAAGCSQRTPRFGASTTVATGSASPHCDGCVHQDGPLTAPERSSRRMRSAAVRGSPSRTFGPPTTKTCR